MSDNLIIICSTERITLVLEDLPSTAPVNIDFLKVAKQLLDALGHLHKVVQAVHGLISSESFVWLGEDLKLAHWPINLLTNGGLSLGAASILPRDLTYVAPEQVRLPGVQATQQSDIWSASLVLIKLIKPDCKLSENPCRLAFCDNSEQVLEQICGKLDETIVPNADMWNQFFRQTLQPDPSARASLEQLYYLLGLEKPTDSSDPLNAPLIPNKYELDQKSISNLDISEIYYLWRLSMGRNFESEQKQDACPPIMKIPYLIVSEKLSNNQPGDIELKSHISINTRPKPIPLDAFKMNTSRLDEKIFHPLILTDEEMLMNQDSRRLSAGTAVNNGLGGVFGTECNMKMSKQTSIESITFADLDSLSVNSNLQSQVKESSKFQPVVIKEADFAYQCERIVLFKRLLAGCPFLKDQLKREASTDIPPYYRAQTWAILLDVSPKKSKLLYDTIDKTTPLATDRQISVDIPRCHQYNELMASPQGHQKLARILKAWLNHDTSEYVYWQGLDSLAAPFLLLNFNDESLAFACFDAFIEKYLKGFFKKDNQLVVQQYLAMFSELLSYHDAPLANHLEKLGFLPNLYAIPWFLTMFTHVLPLHKILHVWDSLLLGDEKYPLCVGLAILNQLRPELMDYSFNDCIVAFSDLPEIDIERCIRDASHFYNSTPDKLINLKMDC